MHSTDMDTRLLPLRERYSAAASVRSPWQGQWESSRRYVRPDVPGTSIVHGSMITTEANNTREETLDSTAPWALTQFAAGMQAYLTNPTEPWFEISPVGLDVEELDEDQRQSLLDLRDFLLFMYSLPDSNFAPATHEGYLDIGAYGTEVLYQYFDENQKILKFTCCPLTECLIEESATGKIDVIHRTVSRTVRQLTEQFPDCAGWELMKTKKPEEKMQLIHSVFPTRNSKHFGFEDPTKRTFTSVYHNPEMPKAFEVSGYETFPYHVARWDKLSGETYGRGPAQHCMPSIRLANKINQELTYSAELANSPPVIIEDNSILLPMSIDGTAKRLTIKPKSVLFKEPNTEFPQPLVSGSQPQFTFEQLQAERDAILKAFVVESLIREQKKERQSVLELTDERSQMLRQLAPAIGRLQTELLSPMIARSMQLLKKYKAFPPSIESRLPDVVYKLAFVGPAARAQHLSMAQDISAFLQDVVALAGTWPEVVQGLDPLEVLSVIAKHRNVPPKMLRTKEALMAEQQRMQAMQEAQVGAGAAQQGAAALADVAQARATDPSGIGSLLG